MRTEIGKGRLEILRKTGRHLRAGHEVHQVRRVAASHDGRHAGHVVGGRDDLQLHIGVERLVDRLPGRVLIERWGRTAGVAGHGGDVGAESGGLGHRLEERLGVGEIAVLESRFVAGQVRLRTLNWNVGRQAGSAGPGRGGGAGGVVRWVGAGAPHASIRNDRPTVATPAMRRNARRSTPARAAAAVSRS